MERARTAVAAIRAQVAETLDVALMALGVSAMVFVMSGNGLFHRRHLLAEARRFLALVQRGRRAPGLDETIVNAAIAAYCLDITEPKTARGPLADYRLYTTHWAHPDPARTRRRSPEAAPDVDHRPASPPRTVRPCRWRWGSRTSRASRSATTARSSPPPPSPTNCAPRAARDAPATTRASPRTSRPRCPNSSSPSSTPPPTSRSRRSGTSRRTTWSGCGHSRGRAETDAQDLTTEQINSIQTRIEEMKERGKALRQRYTPHPEAPAPRPVLEDQQRRQHAGQPGTGRGWPSR
ncbi:hypothetical protein ACFUJU_25100 [Streptomyces sp. NPDC057235]|uniref:hypothetical protein n=1 Tax=Streptomyces sp. NPDC057235 TaxID=3346058 RepID=UPI0036319816